MSARERSTGSGPPAGYSDTPLARKLGIKRGARVALIGAPEDFERTLVQLRDGVELGLQAPGCFDVIVAFFVARSELERRLPGLCDALEQDGGLWLAWPKLGRASPPISETAWSARSGSGAA